LSIAANATLDLRDFDMALTATPLGTASGGTYSGATGLVQRGHNGGAWDGVGGIVTSMADAQAGLTSIGLATAADVLGIAATQTTTWNGMTVNGDTVLLKYTYAGDANLDGQVTGDDYSAIDFNILVPGSSGWYGGDFNFDGVITGDDYSAIDFNILAQGAPL
jgi:hypothetical protein